MAKVEFNAAGKMFELVKGVNGFQLKIDITQEVTEAMKGFEKMGLCRDCLDKLAEAWIEQKQNWMNDVVERSVRGLRG